MTRPRGRTRKMNTETHQAESQLSKFAVNLIRAHYGTNIDDDFKEECRNVADYFDKNGDYQLASYIRVLIGDERDVWVPM